MTNFITSLFAFDLSNNRSLLRTRTSLTVHFMMGGSVNGGKVLGEYPEDFEQSSTNPIALSRGRMVPTTPWDAMWKGTAEWFGVTSDEELNYVLPMAKNFPKDKIYDKAELYV